MLQTKSTKMVKKRMAALFLQRISARARSPPPSAIDDCLQLINSAPFKMPSICHITAAHKIRLPRMFMVMVMAFSLAMRAATALATTTLFIDGML